MRILELDLLAFGPFTDRSLDFSQGGCGLQMIYGPNEAGKSSALRSIDAALFGIPVRSTDNFIHDHKLMRIGCRLENQVGKQLSFLRRKGRTKTLLDSENMAALPDNALVPFLNGVDQETFRRVFGINHDELRRGGDELLRLKGLVGESLFAASLGGGNLAQVLEDLDREAAAIYAPRGSKSAIKQALAELKALREQKKQAEMSTSRWETLRRDLSDARQSHAEVVDRLADQRRQKSRLQRIRKSLKLIREREQLIAQLQELCQVTVLPETYSAERRSQCEGERGPLLTRIETLVAEIEGAEGLREQTKSIQLPKGILTQKSDIEQLRKRLGAHDKAMLDRDQTLRPKRDSLEKQIQRLLRDLDLEREEVDRWRITAEKRALLQELIGEEQSVRGLPGQLTEEVDRLTAECDSLRAAVEALGPDQDVSALRQAYVNAKKGEDVAEELNDRGQSLRALEMDTERQLVSLGMWHGTLAELVALPLPLVATVDRFDEQLRECDEHIGHLNHERRALTDELAEIQLSIDEDCRRHGAVPGEQDLETLRRDRDQLWMQVRSRWLGEVSQNTASEQVPDDKALATDFEQAQVKADAAADRMRAEADRVASLDQRRRRAVAIEQQLPELATQLIGKRAERDTLHSDWVAEWKDAGLENPKSPREMRAWLDRHAALKQLAAHLEHERANVERLRTRLMTTASTLHDALHAAGCPPECLPSPEQLALTALLQLAETRIVQAAEFQQQRAEGLRDLERNAAAIKSKTEQRESAAKRLAEWERRWSNAMQEVGCSGEATARQANVRINRLEELFHHLDDLEDLVARDEGINRDAALFEADVMKLAASFGAAKKELPVHRVAEELFNTFEKAREDKAKLDQLQARRELCQAELDKARSRDAELISELEQLCGLAGVDSVGELAEVERNSNNVIICEQRSKELARDLLDLGEGLSIEQLQQDAVDQDGDALAAQIEELDSNIADLESQRDATAGNVRKLEDERSRAGGGSLAAEADQRMLGIISKAHDDGRRYVQFKLAATVLRNQVERYRSENQDPLLSRASDLFSRVTTEEFTGFAAEYDEDDQPVLAGVRRHGKGKIQVGQMSDGTRDQAYLSLRLAYIEWRLEQYEPIPFIVDDLLIHFDDTRSLATLQVLADLAQRTQVIFFTHHRHLIELAEAHLNPKSLFVHQLSGPAQALDLSVAASRPK